MTEEPRAALAPPRLSWDAEGTMVAVASEQDLMDLLEQIAAGAGDVPPLVELFLPDGSSLAIGVGREASVVTYIRSPEEPDFLSKGSGGATEPLIFSFHGAYSDFPPDAGVPVADALEAMRRFYRTGRRPDNVDWRQD